MFGDIIIFYLLLAVPFFMMSFFRLVITQYKLLFFLLHLVLIFIPFLLPFDNNLRLFFAGFMLASVTYSISVRFKEKRSLSFETATHSVIFIAALFALLSFFDNGSTTVFAVLYISALLIVVTAISYVHIQNLDFNLMMHNNYHKRHEQHGIGVITANNKLVLAFAAILIIGGAVSFFVPLGAAVALVAAGGHWVFSRFLLFIFERLVALIMFLFPNIGELAYFEPVPVNLPEMDMFAPEEDVTSWWTAEVFIIIIIIIVFCLFLYSKYRLKFKFNKKKLKPRAAEDYTTSRVSIFEKGFSRLFPSFRSFVKHPLRRAYIKKIKSHMKHGVTVTQHDTPDKIADKILHREDIGELTTMYEKVRYGRE